tara:strand:- start:4940 stop:5839 length:900 start_codon:yes stop_codon:yes gene_type:complete
MSFILSKIRNRGIQKRIFLERLTEPLHLNILSFFVFLFGNLESKINYDLILRQQHAFSLLEAAKQAKKNGIKKISAIEFGVANGAGLLNIIKISKKIEKRTGVKFQIYGLDSGKGMPKPIDYKDHPEYYSEGDFPMNYECLSKELPDNVELILGDIADTVKILEKKISKESPIGFISFDLDYYSSTVSAFELLKMNKEECFLPLTYFYFDDISSPNHNEYSGVLLAIKEFNISSKFRKIEYNKFLINKRIFTRGKWIKQIYFFHSFDHPLRKEIKENDKKRVLGNPYLNFEDNKDFFNI